MYNSLVSDRCWWAWLKFIKELKSDVNDKRKRHSTLRKARLGVGFGCIIFTGGGGTNASKISVSASGNTSEDGIHLALSSMKKNCLNTNFFLFIITYFLLFITSSYYLFYELLLLFISLLIVCFCSYNRRSESRTIIWNY